MKSLGNFGNILFHVVGLRVSMSPEVWSNREIKAIFTEIQFTFSHLKYPDIYTINQTLEKSQSS